MSEGTKPAVPEALPMLIEYMKDSDMIKSSR